MGKSYAGNRHGNIISSNCVLHDRLVMVQTEHSVRMFPTCAYPEGGTGGPDPHPLKNHKNIGFLSNTDPDPLKNHKAT